MKNVFAAIKMLSIVIILFAFTGKRMAVADLVNTYKDTQYVCLPCGGSCDKEVYTRPGTCSHCGMQLVDKATVKFNSIEPGAICAFMKDMGEQNVVLLDVRTPSEFNGADKDKFGKLKGAVNIPVDDLERRIAELNKFKNKNIIVYCSHSHRSPRASYILMQKGFKKVTNMEYGMSEWKNKTGNDNCSNRLYVKQ